VGIEHKEIHGILTPSRLYKSFIEVGVTPRIASDVTVHERNHAIAHQNAKGIDGQKVKGLGSYGFYFDSNGYYYNLTAYYEPRDWSELSYQDVEKIALANPDPSSADISTANNARAGKVREKDRERVEKIYLSNEINVRMYDLVKHGKELTYEELLLSYGNLIERNKDFVEKALEKAKDNVGKKKIAGDKIDIDIKPVKGTILQQEDLELFDKGDSGVSEQKTDIEIKSEELGLVYQVE
jgi:hypothetical protein